jgi:hypothetical protein
MEPEGSLAYSQEFSTCPCPEPDQSSQYLPSYISEIHLNIIHPPTLGVLNGLFPSWLPSNNLCAFLFSPIRAACPAYVA